MLFVAFSINVVQMLQFDDSLLSNLLRLIQHMQPKKKDTKPVVLSDDKELLRVSFPALAMPNTTADKLMEQLEGLAPKWKEEKVSNSFNLI